MKKFLLAMVCGMLAAACCRNDKTAAEYLSEYSESVLGSKVAAVRFNTVSERDSGAETLEIYAEPNPADTIIGIRFQATSEDSRVIYNGKELFVIGLRDSYRYLQKNDYETSLDNNRRRVGRTERVIIDSRQGDWYVGRTQYDSPEVDQEILIPASERRLLRGRFYDVTITSAADYDLYGEIAAK